MIKGANDRIIKRLKDANDADLPISTIEAKVKLNGVEYVLGVNPELRQGSVANELEFEITENISKTLPLGRLIVEFEIRVPNAEFEVDLIQIDIFRVQIIIE
jgi:hypothetical protein